MPTELLNIPGLRGTILCDHAIANYTSWKIGGKVAYFFQPADLADLVWFLQHWHQEPITVLGAATNVLLKNHSIPGVIIYLRDTLTQLQETGATTLRAEAGVLLASLVQHCADRGMVAATFLTGIPGTVGGAVTMNAGAYGDFIWNHITAVETINRWGEVKLRQAQEFQAGYREVAGLAPHEWYVAGHFNFALGDRAVAQQRVVEYLIKRKRSQPLDLPSCGSVFRNPPNDHAARLIEACGLKGRKIGGAMVSEKHANFIVNVDHATAEEVLKLMQEIVATVLKEQGVNLIPEVHII